MQFQQIRSATSIVTFAGKRFLIDPMLANKAHIRQSPTQQAQVEAIRTVNYRVLLKICLTWTP